MVFRYLIKSRNYTGTLQSTFSAIERINNYTIDNDREGKPIDFTHILDEVMNRVTGESGLRIVDTSNDSASASVWEDDEFDHVLQVINFNVFSKTEIMYIVLLISFGIYYLIEPLRETAPSVRQLQVGQEEKGS